MNELFNERMNTCFRFASPCLPIQCERVAMRVSKDKRVNRGNHSALM